MIRYFRFQNYVCRFQNPIITNTRPTKTPNPPTTTDTDSSSKGGKFPDKPDLTYAPSSSQTKKADNTKMIKPAITSHFINCTKILVCISVIHQLRKG